MQSLNTDIDSIGGGFGGGFGSNPLLWLITLGFLKGNDGLFGNGNQGAGVLAGETQAKLDYLSQGQNTLQHQIANAADAERFGNISNQIDVLAQVSRGIQDTVFRENAAAQRQLSECCCDLKSGQQSIKTDIAMQTATLEASGLRNTQAILDKLCANESAVKDAEIRRLQDQLQTQTIIAQCGGKGGGNS